MDKPQNLLYVSLVGWGDVPVQTRTDVVCRAWKRLQDLRKSAPQDTGQSKRNEILGLTNHQIQPQMPARGAQPGGQGPSAQIIGAGRLLYPTDSQSHEPPTIRREMLRDKAPQLMRRLFNDAI